jgi:hypothetical protein
MGILGMHTIQKRPVAIDDRVEIRPMMFVALTYDHRLVDGKDSYLPGRNRRFPSYSGRNDSVQA